MKQTENITMKELEAIAGDSSIGVPGGLREGIRRQVDTLDLLYGKEQAPSHRRAALRIAGIAASLALIAGIGWGIESYRSRPKDTFDDPMQAYAMLEASFSFISSKFDKSVEDLTLETGAMLSRTAEIIDKMDLNK